MRVVVITKEQTDYARSVTTFLGDFYRSTGKELEVIDPDSPAGTDFCRAYDIVEYPTILAVSDEGSMQSMWRGLPLPTISEVSYYAN